VLALVKNAFDCTTGLTRSGLKTGRLFRDKLNSAVLNISAASVQSSPVLCVSIARKWSFTFEEGRPLSVVAWRS
jgi:hypothetical protein